VPFLFLLYPGMLGGGTWLQFSDAIVSGIVFTGAFALLFGGARITGWRLLDIAAPLSVAVLAVLPNRIGLAIAVVLALLLLFWSRRMEGLQR
jgi:hypothetical protein